MGGIPLITIRRDGHFVGNYRNRVSAHPVKEWAVASPETIPHILEILEGRDLSTRVWRNEGRPRTWVGAHPVLFLGINAEGETRISNPPPHHFWRRIASVWSPLEGSREISPFSSGRFPYPKKKIPKKRPNSQANSRIPLRSETVVKLSKFTFLMCKL